MLDDHQVAERAVARCPGDRAISGGAHGRAGWGRIVGAFMGADSVQDGVATIGVEIGADAEYIQRIAQKGFLHALAVRAEKP